MDTRTYLRAILGDEAGDRAADAMADAMGRTLDKAVLYGTHATHQPIQENDMIRAGDVNDPQPLARVAEVSATVDAGLAQEDLDGMTEAERLGLIVGAAYGKALAERDEARAQASDLRHRLGVLLARCDRVLSLDVLDNLTWAGDETIVIRLRECVQENLEFRPVDSDLTPTQED